MYKIELKAGKISRKIKPNNKVLVKQEDDVVEVENSIKLLKEVIMYEYNDQKVRKAGIENRAGVALTLIGAISLLVIDKIKISEIINRMYVPFDFFDFIFVSSGILFYISFVVSIIFLLLVISTRKYNTFNSKYFGDEYMEDAEEVTEYFLAQYYRDILMNHQERNDVMALQFTIGIYSLMVSIMMIVINLNV